MAVKKTGLGKGLDSMIPVYPVKPRAVAEKPKEEKENKAEKLLKITEVEPNREQPRKKFDEDALLELADSIKQFGVQPHGISHSRTAVTNSMRLLKLDERVQQMLIDDMLTTGHARALLAIEDPELQWKAANRIFDEKMSVRDVEKMVKSLQKDKKEKQEDRKQEDAYTYIYRDMEEKMKAILGTKVKVNHGADHRGKIEIEYYSDEELERIYDMLRSIREGQ